MLRLSALNNFKIGFRAFSSNTAKISDNYAKKERIFNWVRPTKPEEVSILGKEYNQILFKGKNKRPVGLADLRNILMKCVKPEHMKYAVKIVAYYQDKGIDFAEDINSLFIKACINGGQPKVAAENILVVAIIKI